MVRQLQPAPGEFTGHRLYQLPGRQLGVFQAGLLQGEPPACSVPATTRLQIGIALRRVGNQVQPMLSSGA
jgi:hypothetical protein